MNTVNRKSRGLLIALLLGTVGAGVSAAASADEIGYGAAHMTPVVDITIGTGWHGDRYYDGHRYWSRDEWNSHNRHHGPMRHDDHRDRGDHHDH